ncbi:MAG TPA: 50S ribosomal protein L35 [Candidatus Krumholzibacteria bacterium]|nr:50S ribosomal protein L35 [Candidatus Krumholzibacteria bacterium]
MGNGKMKTNRSAAKRFKVVGSGRIKRGRAFKGHLFTAKSPKRLRNLRGKAMIAQVDEERVRRMLGGGK